MWTNDAEHQNSFVANLDAGSVLLSGMTVSYPELPFGGTDHPSLSHDLLHFLHPIQAAHRGIGARLLADHEDTRRGHGAAR